jgi:hypothetical protein
MPGPGKEGGDVAGGEVVPEGSLLTSLSNESWSSEAGERAVTFPSAAGSLGDWFEEPPRRLTWMTSAFTASAPMITTRIADVAAIKAAL